ncbi:CheY-like chemotaxis protein [Saonia flava]|uniref:CheY-like chemotaxis protein n=1 Tax=Saonia flava TaxID=523696 RepID=A0A846QXJ8_9FLAO|nr:response regulator [Saonia flava]NJB70365.1 CheY-like chemotaxis protein [Saonia flava]
MKINFMLIDDSEIDLFVNQKNIEKLEIDSCIKSYTRAKMAVEYLGSLEDQLSLEPMFVPDIILLDINMPEMNGFEFLNKFSELANEKLERTKIYMLSSTTNLSDMRDADEHTTCNGFINKPITKVKLEKIVNELMQ